MAAALVHRVRRFSFGIALAMIGCGSSSSHRPDTGYGAGETPPATINCTDFCQRLGDCAVHLCDEDTMSTQYLGLGDALTSECGTMCTDSLLQMKLSPTTWQCVFESSCRQVFDYDNCHDMAYYYCH
jgi:hypothetical protein